MPTAILFRAIDHPRAVAVLIGYNLPGLLWLVYAWFHPVTAPDGIFCPTVAVLGWCPGCGTTTALAAWLHSGVRLPWYPTLLVAGFLANGVWSLVRAWRIIREEHRVP